MNGLEFTPVANEEYDFVIPQQRLDEPPVQQFIEALRSDEFAKALPPGIRIFERTGEILLIE